MLKKLVLSAAAASAIVLSAGTASAETIRVTLQLPETHPLGVNLNAWKSWTKKVLSFV